MEVPVVVALKAAIARGTAAPSVRLNRELAPRPLVRLVQNALDQNGNRDGAVAEKVAAEPGAVRQGVG
ncbi:hypothetical protein ACFOHY_24285 [Rhizobium rosettiformans]|uniref:hypothetical protein n=1 Tax=Rhizobium rosettiformans TaxID=1368430 RepID=UPI003623D485